MSTARIGGFSFLPGLGARVGGVGFFGDSVPDSVTARIGGVSFTGPVANRLTARVGGVRFTGNPVGAIAAIGSRVVEPFTTVATTAVKTTTSPEIASYTWRQISGPAILLHVTGALCTFEAPGAFTTTTVVLGVSGVTVGGTAVPEQQIVVDVLPHTWFALDGGAWTPDPFFDAIPAASDDESVPIGPASRNGITRPQTYTEDFTRNAAIGAARTVYSEMDYYNGFNDTSTLGLYSPDKTISMHDSLLDVFMHIESGQPLVACILPDAYAPHLGGRWDIRYKTDAPVDGWKFVGMFWPVSDTWNEGEIDWPEADIGDAARPASAIPGSFGTVSAGNMVFLPSVEHFAPSPTTDFHVYSTEWNYDANVDSNNWLRFYFDDVLIAEITGKANLPTKPMRVTLQFETWLNQGAVPTSSPGAHVYVDWIAVWGNPQ